MSARAFRPRLCPSILFAARDVSERSATASRGQRNTRTGAVRVRQGERKRASLLACGGVLHRLGVVDLVRAVLREHSERPSDLCQGRGHRARRAHPLILPAVQSERQPSVARQCRGDIAHLNSRSASARRPGMLTEPSLFLSPRSRGCSSMVVAVAGWTAAVPRSARAARSVEAPSIVDSEKRGERATRVGRKRVW